MLTELFAGSHPASRVPRLRGLWRVLGRGRLVANLTAEGNASIAALHGFAPGLQAGVQAEHLTAGNSCYLSGAEAWVGSPEVDDAIVAFNTDRLRGPEGGEKLCDAVLVMGGPPCQVHSDARAKAPSDEEISASLNTVKAYLRIVKRIRDAAAAVPGGPLIAFVMENPAGKKKNSMHR
jgi:hypothetical protein